MNKMYNQDEEDFFEYLKNIGKHNLKNKGIYLIIIGTFFSIVCIYKNVLIFKIISSMLFGIGIIQIGIDGVLKVNKI